MRILGVHKWGSKHCASKNENFASKIYIEWGEFHFTEKSYNFGVHID